MQASGLLKSQALLDLRLYQAEADMVSGPDIYIWLTECGLPAEVAVRLKELMSVTRKVGEKVISIGKIIALRLIDFIKAHQHLAVGVALGAAAASLAASIPGIGALLAPILLPLGIVVGAVAGHRVDKAAAGGREINGTGIIGVAQDLIEIARKFFHLLIDTFRAVSADLAF